MNEEELETIITQTINSAVTTIPSYLEEIKENKETLKVENPQEFVYGIIMGMALGVSGAILSAQKEMPTTLSRRASRAAQAFAVKPWATTQSVMVHTTV